MPELLYVATNNRHKLEEIRALLVPLGFEVCSAAALGAPEAIEDGATFMDNARKKLAACAALTGAWVLADDSGLEVPALGGAPGVHSARYARPHDDAANNRKLIEALAGREGAARRARFVCALALAHDGGEVFAALGVVEGDLLASPRGNAGFGYDPLFFYPPLGLTFAELDPAQKNRVSHRARALAEVATFLGRARPVAALPHDAD